MSEPSYFDAMDEAFPSVVAAGMLSLLRGAERSGLVDRWLSGDTVEQAAAACDLPVSRVAAVTTALTASGVLEDVDGTPRLAPAWRVLLADSALIDRADLLGRAAVEVRLMETLGDGGDYWSLDAEDRLTYARGISPDPFNPRVVEMLTQGWRADPDLAALSDGGTLLELGCGAAGRTLALLQGVPGLRVVGVELADDLAAAARDRAQQLGVADRFEVVHGDATEFRRPAAFDAGFWSQFFFPTPSRPGALAAMFDSLKPGGVLQAPLAADFAEVRSNPSGPEARYYAMSRVVHDSWGVPERTPEEIVDEVAAAGFVEVEVTGGGPAGPQRLRAVRPG